MAINFPITWPTHIGPASVKFRPVTIVGQTKSTFTMQQKTYEWDGDGWELEIAYPPMKRENAAILIAALTSLRGRLGTFYIGPRGAERSARGTVSGPITVNGGGQSGKTILLSGSGSAKAGDYFQVNHTDYSRLYMALADGPLSSAIDCFPKVRTPSPSNGAGATFSSPVGAFRLAEQGEWDLDRAQIYGVTIKAEEVLEG
jgi:hypothetical protein